MTKKRFPSSLQDVKKNKDGERRKLGEAMMKQQYLLFG
jgi:hypothetical protein